MAPGSGSGSGLKARIWTKSGIPHYFRAGSDYTGPGAQTLNKESKKLKSLKPNDMRRKGAAAGRRAPPCCTECGAPPPPSQIHKLWQANRWRANASKHKRACARHTQANRWRANASERQAASCFTWKATSLESELTPSLDGNGPNRSTQTHMRCGAQASARKAHTAHERERASECVQTPCGDHQRPTGGEYWTWHISDHLGGEYWIRR